MEYVKHKLYAKRWLVLITFISLSAINAFHWIQYAAISGTMCQLWSVSQGSINLFTVIYEATYLPGIIPANWLLLKCGLFWSCICAATLTLLASVLKLFAHTPSGYWLAVGGQVLSGIGQLWILGIPPLLAGRWFGANEVATATSLGVLGNQLGIALGFVTPGLVVNTAPQPNMTEAFVDSVHQQLTWLAYGQLAAVATVLLGIVFGINTGLFYALSTVMDPIIYHYYPDAGASVGEIGMIMIGCGIVSSLLVGPLMDRTHRYKQITLVFYSCAAAFMAAFIAGLYCGHLWSLFAIVGALGFFNTGYLPLGFEFGVELTYPASEANVGGLLNWSAQAQGILLTYLGQWFIDMDMPMGTIILFTGSLAVGFVLTCFIPERLRRQAMERRARCQSQTL